VAKKVFISYSHAQSDWVLRRLVPCLEAGGAEVLIDRDRFEAAKALVGQMDSTQDSADASVLIFSPEYLRSKSCLHEMERAIARDSNFENGSAIPVKRTDCELPHAVCKPNPLYVDLRDEKDDKAWDLLLRACAADLGTTAPDWLRARDEIVQYLERNQSVNLVVKGPVKWRALVDHLAETLGPKSFGMVSLDSAATVSREGLVAEILRACGLASVARISNGLEALNRIAERETVSRLAILHADNIVQRKYGPDLFSSLRFLTMDQRKLVLMVTSRSPFAALLARTPSMPADYESSPIDFKTVELLGSTR
jgi:hypothetical protein